MVAISPIRWKLLMKNWYNCPRRNFLFIILAREATESLLFFGLIIQFVNRSHSWSLIFRSHGVESIKNRVLFLSISFPFNLVFCSDLFETSLVDLSCSCLVSSFRKLFLHLFLPHFFSSEVSFS